MESSQSGDRLRAAARDGDQLSVRRLIREGTPVDEPDEHGHTALSLAVLFGHVETMSVLIDAGADVNARDGSGLTILMLAAAFPRPGVVQLLVNGGADVNAIAADGRTALLNAIWSAESTADVVTILVDAGADVSAADENYGLTPREWAVKTGKQDVAQLLSEAQ